MDFDYFFYIGKVVMGLTEEEFWRSTPRKINALYRIHRRFNGWDKGKEDEDEGERVYHIDEVPFL